MNHLNSNKPKIVVYAPDFQENIGGSIALYNLAKTIHKYQFDCKIFDYTYAQKDNVVFSQYTTENDIDKETIVVYPEIIEGNPLNAQLIVRWILCDLGINCNKDIYKTWKSQDFVYHFSSYNPSKSVKNYNLLCPIYLDLTLQIINKIQCNTNRSGYCHIIRKAHKFHDTLTYIHSPDSLLLDDGLSQEVLIYILKQKKYLVSYDPYSFISFIAALCGCISIVAPIQGYSKDQWIESLNFYQALHELGEASLKGIAYGLDEIDYAKETLNEVYEQQQKVLSYGEETVYRFINDMSYIIDKKSSKDCYPRNPNILTVKDIFPDIVDYDNQISKTIKEDMENEKQKLIGEFKNVLKRIALFYRKKYFQN